MNSLRMSRLAAGAAVLALTLSGFTAAAADIENPHARAFLRSYEEVPAVSSSAWGEFRARLIPDLSAVGEVAAIEWELRYTGLQADWLEAVIRFGQRGVNGNIVVFLCTDLQTNPVLVPFCPAVGNVSGVITPDHVGNGAAAQGIGAGEFGELVRAVRVGATYVNLHSSSFPTGEIRGQILTNRRRDLP